ncbi:hypothetical protein JCM3765_003201 [Sporobolomyces pararoseus]
MEQFDFNAYLSSSVAHQPPILDPNAFLALPQPFQDVQSSNPTRSSTTPSLGSEAPSPTLSEVQQDGKKLKNCAACRMRRVKCEREPGQTSCLKCIAKGLVCTQLPSKPRKTPARTGKRIESAQALFGHSESTGKEDSRALALPPTKRRRPDQSTSVSSELSPTSVVGKLITGELEASLTGSLLELYDAMPQDGRIPLFQATVFRPAFESSGRRLDCLDPRIEPLAAVVLALAARVSDHPLLVGAMAPPPSTLSKAIKEGQDLSEWGKRRTDACQALLDRAMKIADERGIWRDPSPENFATLMMLEGMTDYENAHEPTKLHPTRSIGASYMLHLRSILLDSDTITKERVMSSGVGWTAFCRDAILCATTGSASVFSDDDCCLLDENLPLPIDEAFVFPEIDLENPENPYQASFWVLFNSIMFEIAQLARAAGVKLTGLRATRNPRIDEEFANHFLTTLRKIERGFEIIATRIVHYLGPEEVAIPEAKVVYGFVKTLKATKAGLAFLLHRVLRQRKVTKETSTATEAAKIFQLEEYQQLGGPPRTEDEEYWNRFGILLKEAENLAFEAARELVELFRAQESLNLGTINGMHMLFVRLPMWVSRLIDEPTTEEGGTRSSWTFQTKLEDLRTILLALNKIGWSYASYARPAPWLRSLIAKLETKQQIYLISQLERSPFPFSPIDSTYPFDDANFSSASSSYSPTFFTSNWDQSDISVTTNVDTSEWNNCFNDPTITSQLPPFIDYSSYTTTTTTSTSTSEKDERVLSEMFQNLLS